MSMSNFVNFSKNAFVLKCPCVGRIDRLRIGHDNSGFKAGWYLDKVNCLAHLEQTSL